MTKFDISYAFYRVCFRSLARVRVYNRVRFRVLVHVCVHAHLLIKEKDSGNCLLLKGDF